MNYFAHGRAFLDEPYFLAGTAVPDWLNVVDRKVRVRPKHAAAFLDDLPDVDPDVNHFDGATAAIARGIQRHHRDDAWFHETRAFAELSLAFTAKIRRFLAPADDLRPTFIGHILVELLLDAALIARDPERLHAYYRAIDAVDPAVVERAVNRLAPRQTDKLTVFLRVFCRERFLFDYAMDAKLTFRLNQVLRRVGLPPLPDAFADLLPAARAAVDERVDELLAGSAPAAQPLNI